MFIALLIQYFWSGWQACFWHLFQKLGDWSCMGLNWVLYFIVLVPVSAFGQHCATLATVVLKYHLEFDSVVPLSRLCFSVMISLDMLCLLHFLLTAVSFHTCGLFVTQSIMEPSFVSDSLCSQGWLVTSDSPASSFQVRDCRPAHDTMYTWVYTRDWSQHSVSSGKHSTTEP